MASPPGGAHMHPEQGCMGQPRFTSLHVWKKGKQLAVTIYQMTQEGTFAKDFSLRDQIRRAAVSIPSNIAEGDELDTTKQAIKHFYIAKGSCAEVLTQAIIAHEIGYLDKDLFNRIESECLDLAKMLYALIQARSRNAE